MIQSVSVTVLWWKHEDQGERRTLFVRELHCGGVQLQPGGQDKTNTRPHLLLNVCAERHESTKLEDDSVHKAAEIHCDTTANEKLNLSVSLVYFSFTVYFTLTIFIVQFSLALIV